MGSVERPTLRSVSPLGIVAVSIVTEYLPGAGTGTSQLPLALLVALPITVAPRLTVNTVDAAIGSALEGNGLTRLFSYQVADPVRDGALEVVLPEVESPALPVHIVTPERRLSVPKVRAFVDFAVPRLKSEFTRLADLRRQKKTGGR